MLESGCSAEDECASDISQQRISDGTLQDVSRENPISEFARDPLMQGFRSANNDNARSPFGRADWSEVPTFMVPATIEELTQRYEVGIFGHTATPTTPLVGTSSHATSPASLPTPGANPFPQLSRREAFLLQHFIHRIAPWVRHLLPFKTCI